MVHKEVMRARLKRKVLRRQSAAIRIQSAYRGFRTRFGRCTSRDPLTIDLTDWVVLTDGG